MIRRGAVATCVAILVLLVAASSSSIAQTPTVDTYTLPVTVGRTTVVLVIAIGPDGVPVVTSTTPEVTVGTPLLISSGEGVGTVRSTSIGTLPTVRSSANLRSGPATTQTVVGSARQGDALEIIGISADGQWYALASGAWISASLVQDAPVRSVLTVITAPPSGGAAAGSEQTQSAQVQPAATVVSRAAVLPTATPAPGQTATRSGSSALVVVRLDKVAEFAVIQNTGAEAVDLSGWVLRSERGMQECALGGVIAAGATLVISAMGQQAGFNCGFESNIWNNSEPDAAVLLAPGGIEVSRLQ